MSLKQIEDLVKLANDKVIENVSIVSTKDIEQNFMLHISSEIMSRKKYTPWISQRQTETEDRTIARITVAPTLYGCIIGFNSLLYNAIIFDAKKSEDKQGVYIHEIEFEHCLKPTNKLGCDFSKSDEHWLVTYNEETKEYKGRLIGKMFIRKVELEVISSDSPNITYSMFVEINKEEGIKFSKNIFLKKGYYVIRNKNKIATMDNWMNHNESWDKDKDITVREITKAEYDEGKDESAAMLSVNDSIKPLIAKW